MGWQVSVMKAFVVLVTMVPGLPASAVEQCNPFFGQLYLGSEWWWFGNRIPIIRPDCVLDARNASIYDNGNVGIGTTAPNYKLTVNGYFRAGDAQFAKIGTCSAPYAVSAKYVRVLGKVGVGVSNPDVRVVVDGTFKATRFQESSDASLKEDVRPIENALDAVMKLRGVQYGLRTDPESPSRSRDNLGVIAQEVEQVLPEVVHTDPHGVKSVAYTRIIPVLVEAIKEQQQRLRDMEELVAGLEGTEY